MDSYLAELDERDAPGGERTQTHAIAAEVPSTKADPAHANLHRRSDLGAALVIECGAGHAASDAVVWLPGQRVLFAKPT